MKKITLILTAFIGLGLAHSASALTVQTSNSKVEWLAKKVIGNDKHNGFIPIKSANIVANKKGEPQSAEIVMNLNGFEASDLKGKMKAKFEGHLKSPDFFEVEKYPTAILKIKSIKNGKAMGELTIKDQTQPVTLDFKKKGNTYTGSYILDRTKFGIKYGSNSFIKGLGDKAIADKVDIKFTLVTGTAS